MPLQPNGPISLGDIRTELGTSSNNFSLHGAEFGTYGAINQNSTLKPNGLNPNSISEWYGYDHGRACFCFRITNDGDIGDISYSFIPCGGTQSVVRGTIPQGDYVDICAEAGSVNTTATVTLPPGDCCSTTTTTTTTIGGGGGEFEITPP